VRLVYVAGPYSAPDCWHREQNIRAAETIAVQLVGEGFATVCPHTMARYWFGRVDEATAIAHGFALLERCDALLLVEPGCWMRSRGTAAELVHATQRGIPCFAMAVELRAWARGQRAAALYATRTDDDATPVVVSVRIPEGAR
jgi:nucleoside 2-deoxyribosyltransferase